MTKFDPIKAAREELAGLASVQAVITRRENAAEEAMGLAEVELNAIRKIRGFVRIAIEEHRAKLRQLEEAAEKSTRRPDADGEAMPVPTPLPSGPRPSAGALEIPTLEPSV